MSSPALTDSVLTWRGDVTRCLTQWHQWVLAPNVIENYHYVALSASCIELPQVEFKTIDLNVCAPSQLNFKGLTIKVCKMSAITLYAMGWLRSSHHLRSLQEKLSLRRSRAIWCPWPFLFVPWDQWRLKYTEVQSQQSPSLSNSPMIFTNYLICSVLLEV